jgi:hypothetical protein
MTEYKFQNATVRIHGSVNQERLKSATEKFMKKVLKCQRKQKQGSETK